MARILEQGFPGQAEGSLRLLHFSKDIIRCYWRVDPPNGSDDKIRNVPVSSTCEYPIAFTKVSNLD